MYDNKTNEELIELLEERDETIDNLKQEVEEVVDDSNERINAVQEEYGGCLDSRELEEFTEKAYHSGYDAGFVDCHDNDRAKPMKGQLKHWLEFKMMERLS